jgi:aryl-alcohol dehydrogenase-like predicted oxidoreductase
MNFGSTTPPDTATEILDRFLAAGGTFIDTSNNYNRWIGHGGESEETPRPLDARARHPRRARHRDEVRRQVHTPRRSG